MRRHVETLLSAGILLVSCGGPQQGTVPPGAVPPAQAPAASSVRHAGHGISWMARGVQQRDLLYVSNANGVVNVYRYWQHTLAGVLTSFEKPLGECSDWAGDVYIVDHDAKLIDEYAHGGKKPIKVLHDRSEMPDGCSVDPKTGDVAVANNPDDYYYKGGTLAIFIHGEGRPVFYKGPYDDHFTSCAYDRRGDLLTTSRVGYNGRYTYFYYLPKNGTKLLPIDLKAPGQNSGWGYVQGLAWDGKYWVVESYNNLYRFTINLTAKYVSDTELTSPGYAAAIALYRKGPRAPATEVVAGTGVASNGEVDYWNYPAGGSPIGDLTKDLDAPFGVAVSLRTQ